MRVQVNLLICAAHDFVAFAMRLWQTCKYAPILWDYSFPRKLGTLFMIIFKTLYLTVRLLALTNNAENAYIYADACVRNETENISAERLCAIAHVESRYIFNAVNNSGHCGSWQQHPKWSLMWGDDCYDNYGRLICRQPGGNGLSCEELLDVYVSARVAARHLNYLYRRNNRNYLCRYAGATGQRCVNYTNSVSRIENEISQ